MSNRDKKGKAKEEPQLEKSDREKSRQAHVETLEILSEISAFLETGLTDSQIAYCASLIGRGVNPEALAEVIRTLRTQYPERETGSKDSN
ncbi:uncharacterized protein BDZ99DRAFT_526109 [Mytilinidion resinicola]|uniref:Mitotic-spindle organizing protein 1 n=1 Tax=Mytilinidion resinicola TaxID=574789 RepID=A0A6A6Y5Y3_9PEZI|nr:uncharacterized protein BDZ99DRAFT_526109 [Mytilinidion resinicola]KAF2804070.1 hypothetical protein BDZ99DRAFT_526109 [Mytilinidion resinicola]